MSRNDSRTHLRCHEKDCCFGKHERFLEVQRIMQAFEWSAGHGVGKQSDDVAYQMSEVAVDIDQIPENIYQARNEIGKTYILVKRNWIQNQSGAIGGLWAETLRP